MSAWPQYVMLILLLAQIVWHLAKDKSEQKLSDRVTAVIVSFMVFGLWAGLLYAGGFWAPLVGQ